MSIMQIGARGFPEVTRSKKKIDRNTEKKCYSRTDFTNFLVDRVKLRFYKLQESMLR